MKSKFPTIEKFLDGNNFTIFVSALTIYALFGDDIRILTTNVHADIYFDILTIICISVFTLEIVLSMIAKPGYGNSFFFWLDIISTLSMALDITMLIKVLFMGSAVNTA